MEKKEERLCAALAEAIERLEPAELEKLRIFIAGLEASETKEEPTPES